MLRDYHHRTSFGDATAIDAIISINSKKNLAVQHITAKSAYVIVPGEIIQEKYKKRRGIDVSEILYPIKKDLQLEKQIRELGFIGKIIYW